MYLQPCSIYFLTVIKKTFSCYFLLLAISSVSFAQSVQLQTTDLSPEIETYESLTQTRAEQPRGKGDWSNYEKTFEMQNTYMVNNDSPVFRSDEVADNRTSFKFNLKTETAMSRSWKFKADVGYLYSAQEQRGYPDPKELYMERRWGNKKFAFGKKKIEWSLMDQYWGLGIWQPRFQWEKIRTQQQGLGGFFFASQAARNWSYTLFASPIYVPEFGPSFELEDGSFQARNPWFAPPVKRVTVEGLYDGEDIYFEIDTPDAREFVFSPSFGAQLKNETKNSTTSLSYANKPINQILLSFEGGALVSADRVQVLIEPEFVRHQVVSLEHSRKIGERVSTWLSVGAESIQSRPTNKENHTYQIWQDSAFVAGYLGYRMGRGTELYASQLFTANTVQADTGKYASPGETFFENRIRYLEASRVGLKTKWGFSKSQLSLDLAGTYDYAVSGGTLLSELRWQNRSNLSLFLQADLIGLTTETAPGKPGSFIETYRANDQLSSGVSYVF